MGSGNRTTDPFWINAAGTGLSEVYDGGGNKQFLVTIPAAAGSSKTGSPTGIAFNPSMTDFALPQGSAALFIFDSLDGTISAWNSSVTNAVVVANNSASGAVYTGLAIDNTGPGNFVLAANLAANKIDVFDAKFAATVLSGTLRIPRSHPGMRPSMYTCSITRCLSRMRSRIPLEARQLPEHPPGT